MFNTDCLFQDTIRHLISLSVPKGHGTIDPKGLESKQQLLLLCGT